MHLSVADIDPARPELYGATLWGALCSSASAAPLDPMCSGTNPVAVRASCNDRRYKSIMMVRLTLWVHARVRGAPAIICWVSKKGDRTVRQPEFDKRHPVGNAGGRAAHPVRFRGRLDQTHALTYERLFRLPGLLRPFARLFCPRNFGPFLNRDLASRRLRGKSLFGL